MTTASTYTSFKGRLRMFALAGILAVSAMFPAVSGTLASGDDVVTPTAVVSTDDQFDISGADGLIGLTARVVADGDGANLRAAAEHDAEVVATVPDGTIVDLRVDAVDTVYDPDGVTRWWPVSFNGLDGWIVGFYLTDPDTPVPSDGTAGTTSTTSAPSRTPYEYTGSMTAEISADGDGLVLRVEPDSNSAKVASLSEGTIVELRIDELDTVYDEQGTRWWPVAVDGLEGWVSGFYLIDPGTAGTQPAPTVTIPTTLDPPSADPTDGVFLAGEWAEIRTSDGSGVNLRAGASANADQSGFAPNQALVEILGGPENGWYQVRWDRQVGYVDGSLLIPANPPMLASEARASDTEAASVETAAIDAPDTVGTLTEGDFAMVDAGSDVGINIREEPTQESERAGFLTEGSVVTVTEGPLADAEGVAWYRVTDGGQSGWARGDLLVPTEAPAQVEDVTAPAETDTEGETATEDAATGFILPLSRFTFTQDYGCSSLGFYTYNPTFGCSVHDGVDLAAPSGTPIQAAEGGTVVASGWCDCGLGYYVEIDHGSGLHSVYGHMASQPYVAVGQTVAQGDVIGPVGSTGLSTGPHMHFMVRQDGVTQDPKNYLPPLS
ncbi:MAG TPA: SH3 domain-containing protein [Thermomicrobiales bacterium]|nr:SH3 domain-containing protein [Thermomicrobiales bacterium]